MPDQVRVRPESGDRLPSGALNTAISNRVVQLQRENVGRGAEKARTYVAGNLVVVVLQEALTKAERTLADEGKSDLVLALRSAFQQTMRTGLSTVVEEFTGRRVVAFMSDNHIDPDVGVEVFLLDGPVNGGPVEAAVPS